MHAAKFTELMALLRRNGSLYRSVPDVLLRRAIQLADEVGDFWSRAQVIRWLSKARPHQIDWIRRPLTWLLAAAKRRSPWTVEMADFIVRGWPMIMLRREFLAAVEAHPGAIADALLRLLDNDLMMEGEIPDILLDRLLQMAPGAGGFAAGRVARLVARLHGDDVQWGRRIASWLHYDNLRESRIDIMDSVMTAWPEIFPSLVQIG